MQYGQLLSHVDTDLVNREQLALVETPDATRSFKPVPHIELIATLEDVLRENQIAIRKEQFALRRDGSTLFVVLQLAYTDTPHGAAALGLRTSNNRTMSIQICAGLSVFVCDNMVFRGDLIALNRKHTSPLYLRTEIVHAVSRFQEHFGKLAGEIENLKARSLSDIKAKAKVMLHDVFGEGILPIRLLPEASSLYFEPFVDEFRPRTAWSLHNAFTAVAKEMPITTRMPAIQELGRYFGMSTETGAPAPLAPAACPPPSSQKGEQPMSESPTPASPIPQPPLPNLPCPSCGANILDAGFHNTCAENVRVREDNFTYTEYSRLYLDHTEGDETVDHESDLEAYCGSCDKLLPGRPTLFGASMA